VHLWCIQDTIYEKMQGMERLKRLSVLKLILPSATKPMASSLWTAEPQGSPETFSRGLPNLDSFAARLLS